MLALLRNSFRSRNTNLWKKLYITYVRPLLEYSIQAWSPYLQKDINEIEKVQRRATKIPYALKGLSYAERCLNMQLPTLAERRERGDLIQMHKFEKGLNSISWHTPLVKLESRRRNTQAHYLRECTKNAFRHTFFKNRVVNKWNELDTFITSAVTTNSFKNRLDSLTTTLNNTQQTQQLHHHTNQIC